MVKSTNFKKLLFPISIFFYCLGCSKISSSRISFERETQNFIINQGETWKGFFQFKNTGNENLIIKSVNADCGCTDLKYSKDPIPPGKTGIIEINLNSKLTDAGAVSKSILVESNTDTILHSLTINGYVKPKMAITN
ncbi:DUF1573 domain-containing protein [Desertivirga arenae]|uniref:DUF1573 domain-containing protein n=1 Tax=Desertivirga arenae TaxID=2810309 RepID=UPI001A97CAB2|nr:DUF1573 domain-containing protein [Pedobacter sp. SYSU D00823]